MMENRFFTWVWRFNGLVIAVTATLILLVLVWQLTRDLRRAYFPDRATEVINLAATDNASDAPRRAVQQTTRLGLPEDSTRPGLYAISQYVEQTYTNRGISKESGGNRVNFLVIDTATASTRWLFEGTNRLITDHRALWHRPLDGTPRLLGYVMHVIQEDTTGEGQLTRADGGPLYFVSPDWGTPVRLGDPISTLVSLRPVGTAAFETIQTTDGASSLHRFDLPDATEVLKLDLPSGN